MEPNFSFIFGRGSVDDIYDFCFGLSDLREIGMAYSPTFLVFFGLLHPLVLEASAGSTKQCTYWCVILIRGHAWNFFSR